MEVSRRSFTAGIGLLFPGLAVASTTQSSRTARPAVQEPPPVQVWVARTEPVASAAQLAADSRLEQVAAEVQEYLDLAYPDSPAPAELGEYLAQRHEGVEMGTNPATNYMYWKDPETGEVIRICLLNAEIEVDDGTNDPIVVHVRTRMPL